MPFYFQRRYGNKIFRAVQNHVELHWEKLWLMKNHFFCWLSASSWALRFCGGAPQNPIERISRFGGIMSRSDIRISSRTGLDHSLMVYRQESRSFNASRSSMTSSQLSSLHKIGFGTWKTEKYKIEIWKIIFGFPSPFDTELYGITVFSGCHWR